MSEALLELAAGILGPVADATDDVDVICDAASYAEYQGLAERLRQRGLVEAIDEPVICRWRHRDSGLANDVMPISEEVLGFSNPWYELGIETSIERTLPSGARIRAVAPPIMVAAKLAAWRGRGGGDILTSLDVHDTVVLIDGRPELGDELAAQGEELRAYTADELDSLAGDRYFEYVVQGAVAGYGDATADRARLVVDRRDAMVLRLRAG